MSYDWADMSYQERRAPGVAVVFALAIFLVFLILAAQYQSWGLPFSVLLGTPFAAFGAYLGLWIAGYYSTELREQRVRADWPDHADRPRREERDPDRRVREDGARRRQAPGRVGAERRQVAFPSHSDDRVRVHPRRRAAADGDRSGRRGAESDWHDGVLRDADRDDSGRPADPDAVRRRREGDRRIEETTGTAAVAPSPQMAADGGSH